MISAQPTAVFAALGFEPEDFSERMRGDIIAHLSRGESVLVVSNRAEL
jgi:hypothetical protein